MRRAPALVAALLLVWFETPTIASSDVDPGSKRLTSSDDPGFAETEKGCAGARVLDYLRRHGDLGRIDAELMLELTRDDYEARQRRDVAGDAIGGTVWTSIGPTNGAGRMTAVVTHPTNGGRAFVGAAGGGVWKTLDSGATWTPITEGIANLSVGAIAVAPSVTSTLYLGTGEGGLGVDVIPGIGLLVSTDGGNNWTLPSSVIATQFYKMSVLPTDPNELVVATNVGGLRSTGGQNGPWTTVIASASSVSTTGYGEITDLVRDPSNAQTLYATTWDRNFWCQKFVCGHPINFASPTVLKSTDGGQTWNPASTGLPVSTVDDRVNRWSIAISPSSPSTLYAATSIFNATTGLEVSHVYKTVNSGSTWAETTLSTTGSVKSYLGTKAWYGNTIVVAPTDPDIVIAGGVNYAKSTDGGATWTRILFIGVHVDAHELRYDAGGQLFIANDGGIWTSTDHGATATNRNTNLVTRQFYAMANDPANRNRIFGGQQANGTVRRGDAGGTSWDFFSGGEGFEGAVNPKNPSIVYGTMQSGEVVRSLNARETFVVTSDVTPRYASSPFDLLPFLTILEVNPGDPSIVYTGSHRLWKSVTGGDAWAPMSTVVTGGESWTAFTIGALAISRSNPQVMMVGKAARVYRTTDGGSTWARIDTGGLPVFNVTNLDIHPTDPLTAFVTLARTGGASVYYTTNGGTTWTARSTGLPLFAAQVVRFDPTDPVTLYCGTDVGVYRSTDNGANWSQFGTGLPAVSIYDIEATSDGSLLRAATHGRGVWELNVTGATNNAPSIAISLPPSGPMTIAKGASLDFSGTFSDPDAGDSASGGWHFSDDWISVATTSGATQSHEFHRAGVFPVSLSAVDTFGAVSADTVDITVTESGDACAVPIVIPSTGPFPYTVTVNTAGATAEGSDPASVSSCYPTTAVRTVWLSFTPSATATYNFSLCGSSASANLAGYTGATCGPYSAAFCLLSSVANDDCAAGETTSASLSSGTPYRILLSNYFFDESGEVSLTITQMSNFIPVVNRVSRAVGSTSGGTSVVIVGSGFVEGATSVTFGGTPATGVSVLGTGTLVATTPAHTGGIVDVRVTNPNAAFGTLGFGFTYANVPTPPAPASVVATATSTSVVSVNWTPSPNAMGYQVLRSTDGTSFSVAGTPTSPPFSDTGRSNHTSYLYKVRATGPGGLSGDSNLDAATTTQFTNDPLVVGSTLIHTFHVTEARLAVNAMRTLAGIGAATFTDSSLTGVPVKVVHITELRTALDAARSDLLLPALNYINTLAGGVSPIKAIDFEEVRNGVK